MEIAPPPHIPKHKQGASTFVLACIDPRFTQYLAHFLINEKDIADDYDLFALAGAELGANQTTHKCWKKTFTAHIDVAIDLHDIKQILVFSHMDCGAYKVFKDLEKDDNPKLHKEEIHKLQKFMKKKYPKLIFKGFIMDTKGAIFRVC
jgi:carbonic anhydrase